MTETATATETTSALSIAPEAGLPVLANAMEQSQFIAIDKFGAAECKRIAEYEASVSIHDSNSIALYGAAAQRKTSAVLNDLMKGISTSDIGEAGSLIAEVVTQVKAMNLPKLKREAEGDAPFFASLPVVGPYFSAFRHFRAMHQQASTNLQKIEDKANVHLAQLKAGHALHDRLFDATSENIDELELALVGGQQALMRLRDEFERERAAVAGSRDPRRLTLLRDMAEQINAFETRLVRMHAAYMDALLTLPEVRTAQQAQRIEIQNTLDSILFDIPQIKRAVIRIGALRQISKAADATKARRKLARELGQLGADALQKAYTQAKENQGDVADDIIALSDRASKLLGTIEKGIELDRVNKAKREQGMQALVALKDRLADGLRAQSEQITVA
jgi:uncharacterized protein YaaN involved in tellurite resistance